MQRGTRAFRNEVVAGSGPWGSWLGRHAKTKSQINDSIISSQSCPEFRFVGWTIDAQKACKGPPTTKG